MLTIIVAISRICFFAIEIIGDRDEYELLSEILNCIGYYSYLFIALLQFAQMLELAVQV